MIKYDVYHTNVSVINNQKPCVMVKVIADYDYNYNIIDHNGDCDYLRMCN